MAAPARESSRCRYLVAVLGRHQELQTSRARRRLWSPSKTPGTGIAAHVPRIACIRAAPAGKRSAHNLKGRHHQKAFFTKPMRQSRNRSELARLYPHAISSRRALPSLQGKAQKASRGCRWSGGWNSGAGCGTGACLLDGRTQTEGDPGPCSDGQQPPMRAVGA